VLGPHPLRMTVEDGVAADADVAQLVRFDYVFGALANADTFVAGSVATEAGTVAWPSGVNLDPDMLDAEVTGVPIEQRLVGVEESEALRRATGRCSQMRGSVSCAGCFRNPYVN